MTKHSSPLQVDGPSREREGGGGLEIGHLSNAVPGFLRGK